MSGRGEWLIDKTTKGMKIEQKYVADLVREERGKMGIRRDERKKIGKEEEMKKKKKEEMRRKEERKKKGKRK